MFEFHSDRNRYFEIQVANAAQYVIPFIEEKFQLKQGARVLEIGCGEGGVMKAFVQKGCTCVGVEFDVPRIELGTELLAAEIQNKKIRFITKDIYDISDVAELGGAFDLIILKDVIEHIHDQPKLIKWMHQFLKPGGAVFFGFPPWQMPFGGHQQICKNKWLSKLPYYHLLPGFVYKWILKSNGENWEEMMEIRETGISIERFERICKQTGYNILNRKHYLINPIYQWKFGWKPREQFRIMKSILMVRNFFTTCVYYLITPFTD